MACTDPPNKELSRTAVLPNDVRLAGGVCSSDKLICRANSLRTRYNREKRGQINLLLDDSVNRSLSDLVFCEPSLQHRGNGIKTLVVSLFLMHASSA